MTTNTAPPSPRRVKRTSHSRGVTVQVPFRRLRIRSDIYVATPFGKLLYIHIHYVSSPESEFTTDAFIQRRTTNRVVSPGLNLLRPYDYIHSTLFTPPDYKAGTVSDLELHTQRWLSSAANDKANYYHPGRPSAWLFMIV